MYVKGRGGGESGRLGANSTIKGSFQQRGTIRYAREKHKDKGGSGALKFMSQDS